tara:strand:+ start:201 stop:386 length:186 start_codon:yes stop_codon:yes gene_type:complete
MVVGDLVKFKFTFELPGGKFINRGDIGIIESKAMWWVNILHVDSGEYITTKQSSIEKLEEL